MYKTIHKLLQKQMFIYQHGKSCKTKGGTYGESFDSVLKLIC